MSILLLVGLPSWQAFVTRQSVSVSANALETSIKFARTAAVTDGHCAVVMRAADAGWQNGWSVFRDCRRNGVFDAEENQLLVRNDVLERVGIAGNAHAASYLLFEADGSSKRINGALGMASITLCPQSNWQHADCLRLTLNATGRLRRYKPNSG